MVRIPFILSILLVHHFSFQVQDEPDRTWTSHLEEELVKTVAQNDLEIGGPYTLIITRGTIF